MTHVDGTGRVQTITSPQNPKLYELIKEYEKLNETIAFTDGSTAREWSDNYFLGGGISQGDDRVKFEILILLNLNPESTTFNQTPVEYRFGFNVNF